MRCSWDGLSGLCSPRKQALFMGSSPIATWPGTFQECYHHLLEISLVSNVTAIQGIRSGELGVKAVNRQKWLMARG